MRALVIPQIAGFEVAAESDYYSHRCIMRAVDEFERSFFYIWLDARQEGKMWAEPNQSMFYEDCLRGFTPQMASASGRIVELFSRQTGKYPVDCVFTSRAGFAPTLAVALTNVAGPPVPVVITEPRVYWIGSEAKHNTVKYHDTILRAAGYASCFAIYWSAWEKKEALDAASLIVASSGLKWADEHGFVVDPLVEVPTSPPKGERTKKRLLFAGRLNENKRYRDILEAYGKVLMTRQDVEVWIHSGTGAYAKLDPADSRWHRTSERLTHDGYAELLGQSDVAAYMSRDEGANITVLEMLLAGIVVALPLRPWVEKLFWPLEYPFTCRDKDFPAMLDWMLDNLDKCRGMLTPIVSLIKARNSWPAFRLKMGSLMDAIRETPQVEAFRVFRNMTMELLEHKNRSQVGLDQMLTATPDWTSHPIFAATRSNYACYQAVRDMDDLRAASPMLVKPKLPVEAKKS